MDFPFYFQILLGQWQGVISDIPYGLFRIFSPFLPTKNCQGGFFFRFEHGSSKLIPYTHVDCTYQSVGQINFKISIVANKKVCKLTSSWLARPWFWSKRAVQQIFLTTKLSPSYSCVKSPLHYTALHCNELHYTTLHYTTLRYATLHYTTL